MRSLSATLTHKDARTGWEIGGSSVRGQLRNQSSLEPRGTATRAILVQLQTYCVEAGIRHSQDSKGIHKIHADQPQRGRTFLQPGPPPPSNERAALTGAKWLASGSGTDHPSGMPTLIKILLEEGQLQRFPGTSLG